VEGVGDGKHVGGDTITITIRPFELAYSYVYDSHSVITKEV